MKCPHCQTETNEDPCSNCGQVIASYQVDTNKNPKNDEVLEPEIVDDNGWDKRRQQPSQGGSRYTYKNYTLINPQFNMNNSCLPSFVGLGLFIFVFFQLGFLAALGFAFFLLIGKAFSFYVVLKNFSKGIIIPPILLDAAVWLIAYGLVVWLSE